MQIRVREAIPALLHMLNHHSCKRAAHCISDNFQLLNDSFSAQQSSFPMKKMCIERCRHTDLLHHLSMTHVEQQLHKPRTVQLRYKIAPIPKDLKEEISNAIFPYNIHIDGHEDFENMNNLSSFKLLERHFITSYKLKFVHCRIPLQNHEILSIHEFLCA